MLCEMANVLWHNGHIVQSRILDCLGAVLVASLNGFCG